MKFFSLKALFLLCVAGSAHGEELSYEEYLKKMNVKNYSPEEKERRRKIYEESLEVIRKQQKETDNFGSSWALSFIHQFNSDDVYKSAMTGIVYGITSFSDWTDEEFMKRRLMTPGILVKKATKTAKPPSTRGSKSLPTKGGRRLQAAPFDLSKLPKKVDWMTKKKMVPDDQGDCNCCYVISTLVLLEYRITDVYKVNLRLSTQEVIDCAPEMFMTVLDVPCEGGQPRNVFDYIMGGISKLSAYPAYEKSPTNKQGCRVNNRSLQAVSSLPVSGEVPHALSVNPELDQESQRRVYDFGGELEAPGAASKPNSASVPASTAGVGLAGKNASVPARAPTPTPVAATTFFPARASTPAAISISAPAPASVPVSAFTAKPQTTEPSLQSKKALFSSAQPISNQKKIFSGAKPNGKLSQATANSERGENFVLIEEIEEEERRLPITRKPMATDVSDQPVPVDQATVPVPVMVMATPIATPAPVPNTPPKSIKEQIESNSRFSLTKGYQELPDIVNTLIYALSKGPVVVAHAVPGDMKLYTSGVISCDKCKKMTTSRNHAALATGYELNGDNSSITFMSSWGTNWGIAGFYKIQLDLNDLSGQGCCLVSGGGMNISSEDITFI